MRAKCCRKWFDCPQCHAEQADHELKRTTTMALACKKCKKAFRKNLEDDEMDDADNYCPHCDNLYVLPAVEGEAAASSSAPMQYVEMDAEDLDARVQNKTQGPTFGRGIYY